MKILLFGKIREDYSKSEINLEIEENSNFLNILKSLNIDLSSYKNLMFSLNKEYISCEYINTLSIKNTDIIALIPAINAG